MTKSLALYRLGEIKEYLESPLDINKLIKLDALRALELLIKRIKTIKE